MKASVEEINSVQKRVKVELSEEMVSEAFNEMFKDIRTKATIKGFRKGKAPMAMIRRLYGSSVANDVFQKLIRDNLFGAIEKNELRPVASPVIETQDMPEQGKGYSFSALVDVMPPLNIEGYKDLSVSVDKLEVTDEMINEELKYIQSSKAKTKPVEGEVAVAEGHMITMSHTARLNGEEVKQMAVVDAGVEIGGNQLLSDLEQAFVGMKVGEPKNATITLPENYGDKDLAGKSLEFTLTVSDIKEMVRPELDDELAKDLNMESLEDLKNNIRSSIQQRFDQMKRQQLESSLIKQICEKNPFDVPPSIVDQVLDSIIGELGWKNDGDKKRALSDRNLRDRYREQAISRAKNTLVLLEIAGKEEVKVTDDDIDAHIQKMIPAGSEGIKPEFLENMRASLAPQLRENLIFDKTLNLIIDSAKVAEVPNK